MDKSLINRIKQNLDKFSEEELREAIELIEELSILEQRSDAAKDFLSYVKYIWPQFIPGRHHTIMAEAFDRVISGDLKRLIINMPPRHTKSEFASKYLPSYFIGKYPGKYLIQTSHTLDLAADFGRQVRNLVDTTEYRELFPDVVLSQDSKAAGRWHTKQGGRYFAAGVGGAIAGRGADLLIIDDPHSEKDSFGQGKDAFEHVHNWYVTGPRQRLQPDAAVIIVMTRWHQRDLTGAVLRDSVQKQGSDDWEVIEFPAILPSGNPLWPEYWPLELLEKLKAELPTARWAAQYMQNPVSEGSAIVKREWWRKWPHDQPPKVKMLILSLDPAFTKDRKNDPSGVTVWAVFEHENEHGEKIDNLIVLDAYQDWMEFPDLKIRMKQEYEKWKPDVFIIENTSSGIGLIQEFQMIGIPVSPHNPSRLRSGGKDKVLRVNKVADIFSNGLVWYPDKPWARELIEQFAEFPNGDHDDLVDSSTQAIQRYRDGGVIVLDTDYKDENTRPYYNNRRYY